MPSITEYQSALIACLTADPPVKERLSKDASRLTDVWVEMAYNKEAARPLESLKADQLAAYERWRPNSKPEFSHSPTLP